MIDQEARDMANDAINAISSHERVCTERWTQLRDAMVAQASAMNAAADDRKKDIGGLYKHLWAAHGAVMAALFAVVMFLIQR